MIGIGIESSCDETSIALVRDGKECLANIVFSQIQEHAPFQGIVPEIASRAHLEKINFLYEEALQVAGIEVGNIDYIGVSVQPGLIGSLMVGASFAKCLALVQSLPIVRVDHLEAHLYAPVLENWKPSYPFLGLLLSGGNSAIYEIKEPGKLEVLADTIDDACGEAFDKVASFLGLGYPGGPLVEKTAVEYQNNQIHKGTKEMPLFAPLLRKWPEEKNAFSFSGIKTAVRLAHKKQIKAGKICYDFQNTIFELIERNLIKACKHTGIQNVVAAGGVLANDTLRERLSKLAQKKGLYLTYPQNKTYCTDNAAMIAAMAYFLRGTSYETNTLDFGVDSKRRLF